MEKFLWSLNFMIAHDVFLPPQVGHGAYDDVRACAYARNCTRVHLAAETLSQRASCIVHVVTVRLHVASFAQGKVRTFPLHYIRTITELRLGGVGH